MTDSLTPNEQAGTLTHHRVGCNYMQCWGKLHGVKGECPYFLNPDYRPDDTQTTPSKAVSREQIQRLIVENRNSLNDPTTNDPYDMTGIVDDVLNLITTTLTQHNEALLAKLPEKHKFTDKPRNTIHAMANEAEVNGFNDCLDQVTAIIKGSTHD